MAFFESRSSKSLRMKRQRKLYPELEQADFTEIAELDAFARARGQEPSSFGHAVENSLARVGVPEEEQREIDQRFGRRPPVIPDFGPPEQPSVERTVGGLDLTQGERDRLTRTSGIGTEEIEALASLPRTEVERITQDPVELRKFLSQSTKGFETLPGIEALEEFEPQRRDAGQPRFVERDLDLGAGFQLDVGALAEGVRDAPGALVGRTAGAASRTGEFGQALAPGGAAEQIVESLDVRDPETVEAIREIEEVAAAPIELGVSLAPILSANLLDSEGRIDSDRVMAFSMSGVDGEAFFETVVRAATGGEAGLKDIGIDVEEMNPLTRALFRSLAPINVVAAGATGGATRTLRLAAQDARLARPALAPVRLALNAAAGAVEPFEQATFGGRLSREIAVDVAAQAGYGASEGLPTPVRTLAALAAGIVTASLTDPRVVGRIAAPTELDPTAATRAAGELPSGAVAPVVDPATGQVRAVRAGAGAAGEAVEPSDLAAAQDALRNAYVEERNIRGRGIPQEELSAGRAQQARGIERALEEGAGVGFTGEELVQQARQGAAVPGGIRETFAQPVQLTEPQRNAVFDELARRMREGEIDSFEFLNTARAVERVMSGEGLRQFEIDNPILRSLVGDEVVTAVGSRGPRDTLDRADAALRRETDRFIETAERQQLRAAEAQARVDLKALDARIAELDQPIDITTGTGARALLAHPDVEDVARARREVELLASRTEARALRTADKARVREIDRDIKALEQKFEREVRAFDRTDAAEVAKIRRELAQIEQRNIAADATAAERAAAQDIDARLAQLEEQIDFTTPIGVRASFIDEAATLTASARRARNAADATVRNQTDRLNQQAITRQLNASSRQAAKDFRQDFNLVAALESRHPNTNTLLTRVDELMDQPITGTARGEVPRGETGLPTGPRATPEQPRVPVDLRDDVRKTIDEWLYGTEARLSNQAVEGLPIVRSVQATLNGQLDSPALTWAVYRRSVLTDALVNQGMEPDVARQIGDTLMDEQLGRRLGDGFTEIRAGRKQARTDVRNRLRAESGEQFVDDTTDEFRRLVDDQLVATFENRYGRPLLSQEARINEQLEQLRTGQGFQKVDEFVQASKNTMFGVWDVGVLGIQLPTAINRGGIPLMAKMINDALAVMHLPNARHLYSEGFLPKQVQYALDGVDQSARAAVYEAGSPSLIGLLGGRPGRLIDRPLTAVADRMTEFQFGTVLGGVRNAAYEGNLMLIHVAGMAADRFKLPGNFDIADPVVRQTAASFANNVGSSALPALRGNRNVAERILVTSNRMMRSRVNHITLAAKLLTPQASAAERVLAATTIASSMFYTLAFAKFVNEIYGLTDYEFDPSKPGFGLITVESPTGGEPRIIDTVPQDSTTRAFAKSIRILAENEDPALIAEAWARVYYGSASIIGRVPTTMFGYGYEPGVGFRSGDMTREGQIRSLAPIPPVFSFLYEEGLESFGLALEAVGVGNFPEGSYGKANRLLESAGVDPDELNSRERSQALADLGVAHEISAQSREELEERGERNDREAEALLLKYERQDELTRIYDDVIENGGGKPGYRDRRGDARRDFAIVGSTYDDIWRGFAESDDEVQRLAGERYELRDQATTGTETDYETLEELEAAFDASMAPTLREDVMAYINAIDPLANPWEQEYDTLQVTLASDGWYEIDDRLWADLSREFAPEIQGARSFYEFRENEQQRIRSAAQAEGFSPGEVEGVVRSQWSSNDINQAWTDNRRERRSEWAISSPDNLSLASQASEWGLWAPPDDIEEAFSILGGP